jgi:hypothetical protein
MRMTDPAGASVSVAVLVTVLVTVLNEDAGGE